MKIYSLYETSNLSNERLEILHAQNLFFSTEVVMMLLFPESLKLGLTGFVQDDMFLNGTLTSLSYLFDYRVNYLEQDRFEIGGFRSV